MNNKTKKQESEETEDHDPVASIIGNFGKWQLLVTFFLSLFNIPCTLHIFAPTFQAFPRDFWCTPPPHLKNLDPAIWKEVSQPHNACTILDLSWTEFTPQQLINASIPKAPLLPCQHWTFSNAPSSGIDTRTIISEWSLVCHRERYIHLAETSFLIGVALGGFVGGIISDKFGRKTTFASVFCVQTVVGTLIAFVPWFEAYVVLRFILGFVSVSVVFCGFVLALEIVGGVWRTVTGVSYLLPTSLSYAFASLIAYFVQDNWRNLQLAIAIPGCVLMVALWKPIPESPRWLLALGKKEKYYNVMKVATKFNNLPLPTEEQIGNSFKHMQQTMKEHKEAGIWDLFRTSELRKRSICLFVLWFILYFIYYGLALNINQFAGDVYVNAALSGLVEIPALAVSILVLVKLGRKLPLCLTFFLSGIACLATLFVGKMGEQSELFSTAFALLAKLSISSSNAVLPVYTAELYPTVIRNLGVGACNIPAGTALILMPYVWMMKGYLQTLPMIVLGVCGVIGGLVLLFLPETGNKPLSETISEEEHHGHAHATSQT